MWDSDEVGLRAKEKQKRSWDRVCRFEGDIWIQESDEEFCFLLSKWDDRCRGAILTG